MPSSYSPIASVAFGRLPPNDSDFSTRWRSIKSSFARAIAPGERLSNRRQTKHERGVWQRKFWEHAIQDHGIVTRTSTIFTSIRSSMAGWLGWPIGRIRASIDSCAWGSIRRNGRPRRLLGNGIWNDGADLSKGGLRDKAANPPYTSVFMIRHRRATAWAAIPSSRPAKPMPSVVVPLRLTCPGSIRRSAARFSRMAAK